MQAISCIRSKRLLQGKETVFSNYGQPINPEKIDRWEQRHDNPSADGIQSSPPTPPGVTYITPTSSPTSSSPPRDRILNPQAPSFSPEPATATPGYGQAPPQQNFGCQQVGELSPRALTETEASSRQYLQMLAMVMATGMDMAVGICIASRLPNLFPGPVSAPEGCNDFHEADCQSNASNQLQHVLRQ